MEKILRGVRHFKRHLFAHQRGLFERLASQKQQPLALFITCSDSRINPNLITQTEPGELFILRNAGNIIPPYRAASGGEGATVEYAVSALGLRHIIVCGHYHCGAMQGLIRGEGQDMPAVRAWFNHAETTRRIAEKSAHLPADALARLAVEQNVLAQIDNLRTHPSVAVGLAGGELELYAWVYRIETGDILAYNPGERRFLSLAEHEVTALPTLPPAGLAEPAPQV